MTRPLHIDPVAERLSLLTRAPGLPAGTVEADIADALANATFPPRLTADAGQRRKACAIAEWLRSKGWTITK